MTGERDLAILTSGNREMSLKRNRDSGIPEMKICKGNQGVILGHLIKDGDSRTMTDIHVFHEPITLLCNPYMVICGLFS